MPLSFEITSGNGTTTNFAVPFQFLDRTHVHFFVNDIEVPVTWVGTATVQITPAPPSGTGNVLLRRTTERAFPLVDYHNGSNLFDSDLDIGVLQNLFIAQEYFEQILSGISGGSSGGAHALDSHTDATPAESQVKGAMRVYANDGKTRAIVATDGGILHGDAADFKGVRFLPVGTTGQVLEVDTTLGGRLGWKQGLRNLLSAAGDLLVASASGVGSALGVGPNNAVLVADAAAALKMAWKTTLAGLTLTSPTINGGALNTPTISSPAINGGTISNVAWTNGSITGASISGGTISGVSIALGAASVGQTQLKTAVGSASGALSHIVLSAAITAHAFALGIPTFRRTAFTNQGNFSIDPAQSTVDDFGSRFLLSSFGVGPAWSVSFFSQWLYITATDNPAIWVAFNPTTGEITTVWAADDPLPGDTPGVSIEGAILKKFTSKDLEHLTRLNEKSAEAANLIRHTKRKMDHQAYRAMQLISGQDAPSLWILENCRINTNNRKIEQK
ncbi:MAG: phage tail fiber protein [Cetobacterium sp.]